MDVHLITSTGVQRRSPEEIPELLAQPEGLLWVDIPAGNPGTWHVLSEVFKFHPLAVKDALERNRVPKMHAYADDVLVILHAPEPGERGHVHFVELDQFIGRRYLVTVHGPLNPAVGEPEQFLDELFRVRHGLLAARTIAALGSAIYSRLATLDSLPEEDTRLVADNADQFVRVRRLADGEREYLQGVIEFYQGILTVRSTAAATAQNEKIERLTEAGYAQNEEVKKISSWAAIFFAPSLVAAVYGMNFVHMPELDWTFGYPYALALMVASALVLYWTFKKRNWL